MFRLDPPQAEAGPEVRLNLLIENRSGHTVANLCARLDLDSGGTGDVIGKRTVAGLHIPPNDRTSISLRLSLPSPGTRQLLISHITMRWCGMGWQMPPSSCGIAVAARAERKPEPEPDQPPVHIPITDVRSLIASLPGGVPAGSGHQVFVSFDGDLRRERGKTVVDWQRWLLQHVNPLLAPLPSRPEHGTGPLRPLELWFYDAPESGLRPGARWMREIGVKMHLAPAALLLLTPGYLASFHCASYEAPFLVWRHQTQGLPVFPVRILPTNRPVVTYPCGVQDVEFDLDQINHELAGHPERLGSSEQDTLQELVERGRPAEARHRLNGLARAIQASLRGPT